MKCNELMVGDWVADKYGYQLQSVFVGNGYVSFEDDEGNLCQIDDKNNEPQPIEITIELLRNNGWWVKDGTYTSNDKTYLMETIIGNNRLDWKFGTLTIWLDYKNDNSVSYADIIFPCKYVHQLQQILRLAGMVEPANNFKMK